MKLYVNQTARAGGDGTPKRPFATISEAARIAAAGDEVVVAPGLYREAVSPEYGGTSNSCRIHYISEQPGKAIISGAEPAKNWTRYQDDVWYTSIPNGFFGAYNPYTTLIDGDWYFRVMPVHTGQVFLNGKALYETNSLDSVLKPVPYALSWDPDFSIYKWFTQQKDGYTEIFANFHGLDPNQENVEFTVRRTCFYPEKTGRNYITLTGFCIKQAATQWAPPTAYQEGMVGPHWAKGWIIEDCEISASRCSGISLGKYLQPNNENKWTHQKFKHGTQTERDAICQAQNEGWSKENIGSHIVRRCNIHDCGQAGIVGHLGCIFSTIEDNHIHHINNMQDLIGAEIGGIKLHAAIDTVIRRNHIHHCTRGLWLDWQAQGTRVTQNFFHDNVPPAGTKAIKTALIGEDVFVEVSHGPTLLDNNLMLSPCSCRISTQGLALVHNLIAGSFTYVGKGNGNGGKKFPSERYTPYHVPHQTAIAGFMTLLHGDMRFFNNVFVQSHARRDLEEIVEANNFMADEFGKLNLVCGTHPYNGYPTREEWEKRFKRSGGAVDPGIRGDCYYDHLPIYTGGNVFFNGAKACDKEVGFEQNDTDTIRLEVREKDGSYWLDTDLYQYLHNRKVGFISSEMLGEAFEPEQKFENPDGTSLIFDTDYFGNGRKMHTMPGPFDSEAELDCMLNGNTIF